VQDLATSYITAGGFQHCYEKLICSDFFCNNIYMNFW